MNPLSLQLQLAPATLRIIVRGRLCAANAHLLPKVVIGSLRRYATPAVELDLGKVDTLDGVGVAALLDCQRYAARCGIPFTISRANAHLRSLLSRYDAADLLPRRPPPRQPQTGTVCLPRSANADAP